MKRLFFSLLFILIIASCGVSTPLPPLPPPPPPPPDEEFEDRPASPDQGRPKTGFTLPSDWEAKKLVNYATPQPYQPPLGGFVPVDVPEFESHTKHPNVYGVNLSNTDSSNQLSGIESVSGQPVYKVLNWFDVIEIQYGVANRNSNQWLQNGSPSHNQSYASFVRAQTANDPFIFGYTYLVGDSTAFEYKGVNSTDWHAGSVQKNGTTRALPPVANYASSLAFKDYQGWFANGMDWDTWGGCSKTTNMHLCHASEFMTLSRTDPVTNVYIDTDVIQNTYNGPHALKLDAGNGVGAETYVEFMCRQAVTVNREHGSGVDGIRDDVANVHFQSMLDPSNTWDANLIGGDDLTEYGVHDWRDENGWRWMSYNLNNGRMDYYSCLRANGLIAGANAAGEPDWTTSYQSGNTFQYKDALDMIMIEQSTSHIQEFFYIGFDVTTKLVNHSCDWGCLRKTIGAWIDMGVPIGFLGLGSAGDAGDYSNPALFDFASTLQQDAFSGWADLKYSNTNWKEYYSVSFNDSAKVCNPANDGVHNDWLGTGESSLKNGSVASPVTMTSQLAGQTFIQVHGTVADHAWGRKFTNGYVAVNPTSTAQNITLPHSHYKLIGASGYYDADGTFSLPAKTGIVLCDIDAMDNPTTPTTHALTVTVTGSGTVTSSPSGITCPGTCSHDYDVTTAVTLTATAGSGYAFTGWSGSCSGTGACLVTMHSAKHVTATFTQSGTLPTPVPVPPPTAIIATPPRPL